MSTGACTSSGPSVPRPGQPPRGAGGWWSRSNVAANDPAHRALAADEPFVDSDVPTELLQQCEQCGANVGALDATGLDLQSLLAGAVRVGEQVATEAAYADGYADGSSGQWRWGFTCGVLTIVVLLLVLIASGYLRGVVL